MVKKTKGVSAVIATILMLLITIALAGTAYLYITGVFTSRTTVALSIDPSTSCAASGGVISLVLKNDGSGVATVSAVTFTTPAGVAMSPVSNCTGGGNIFGANANINSGGSATAYCTRTAGSGTFGITATAGTSTATGNVYCSS